MWGEVTETCRADTTAEIHQLVGTPQTWKGGTKPGQESLLCPEWVKLLGSGNGNNAGKKFGARSSRAWFANVNFSQRELAAEKVFAAKHQYLIGYLKSTSAAELRAGAERTDQPRSCC